MNTVSVPAKPQFLQEVTDVPSTTDEPLPITDDLVDVRVANENCRNASEEAWEKVANVINSMDTNRDYTISYDELREFLGTETTGDFINERIFEVDFNYDGKVQIDELCKSSQEFVDTNGNPPPRADDLLVREKCPLFRRGNQLEALYKLKRIDANGDGLVTAEEVLEVIKSENPGFDRDEDVRKDVNTYDTNQDGALDLGEFCDAQGDPYVPVPEDGTYGYADVNATLE